MNLDERKYCILGAGGFGRETLLCLIDIYRDTDHAIEDIAVFMVSDEYYTDERVLNVPVIKHSEFDPSQYAVVIAIGDPAERKKIAQQLPQDTFFTSIIHPSAIISDWVKIGHGSIITAGAIITCDISIGQHAHLNLHTTIGHDCRIGDFFTTAPGANISGNCKVGDCVYFGSSAAVREGIEICSNVTIGMGGVVVKHIEEEGIYVGNPVCRLKN